MTHIIFIYSTFIFFAVFTCFSIRIFCLLFCMESGTGTVDGNGKRPGRKISDRNKSGNGKDDDKADGIVRLWIIGGFFLFLFSQVAAVYLQNVNMLTKDWIYELSEVSLVFLAPAVFLHGSGIVRKRRIYLIVTMGLSTLAGGAYFYANFFNFHVWELFYPLYCSLTGISFILYSILIFPKERAPGEFRAVPGSSRIFSIATISIVLCYYVSTVFPVIHFPLELFLLPLLILLWSVRFTVSDIGTLISKPRAGGVFDIDDIGRRFSFSPREKEVVDLLLQGKRYQDIGDALYISKATVKTYISRVYTKLGVSSKIELVNKISS